MSGTPNAPAADEKHRVLVVEGDPAEANELVSLLAKDFDVTLASSAEDAFAELRAASFHVVCSSEAPSGADPVTFLRRVLSVPDPPCLLMITSEAEMRDKKLDGLSGVIVKPFNEAAFVARVKRLSLVAQMRRRVDSVRDAMEREGGDSS